MPPAPRPRNNQEVLCGQPLVYVANNPSKKVTWTGAEDRKMYAHLARHQVNLRNVSFLFVDELLHALDCARWGSEYKHIALPRIVSSLKYKLSKLVAQGVLVKDPITGFEKWPAWTLNWAEPDWDGDILMPEVMAPPGHARHNQNQNQNQNQMPNQNQRPQNMEPTPDPSPNCHGNNNNGSYIPMYAAMVPNVNMVVDDTLLSRVFKKTLKLGTKFHMPGISSKEDAQDRVPNKDGDGDIHMSDAATIVHHQSENDFDASLQNQFAMAAQSKTSNKMTGRLEKLAKKMRRDRTHLPWTIGSFIKKPKTDVEKAGCNTGDVQTQTQMPMHEITQPHFQRQDLQPTHGFQQLEIHQPPQFQHQHQHQQQSQQAQQYPIYQDCQFQYQQHQHASFGALEVPVHSVLSGTTINEAGIHSAIQVPVTPREAEATTVPDARVPDESTHTAPIYPPVPVQEPHRMVFIDPFVIVDQPPVQACHEQGGSSASLNNAGMATIETPGVARRDTQPVQIKPEIPEDARMSSTTRPYQVPSQQQQQQQPFYGIEEVAQRGVATVPCPPTPPPVPPKEPLPFLSESRWAPKPIHEAVTIRHHHSTQSKEPAAFPVTVTALITMERHDQRNNREHLAGSGPVIHTKAAVSESQNIQTSSAGNATTSPFVTKHVAAAINASAVKPGAADINAHTSTTAAALVTSSTDRWVQETTELLHRQEDPAHQPDTFRQVDRLISHSSPSFPLPPPPPQVPPSYQYNRDRDQDDGIGGGPGWRVSTKTKSAHTYYSIDDEGPDITTHIHRLLVQKRADIIEVSSLLRRSVAECARVAVMRVKQEIDEENLQAWAPKLANEGKRLEGELAVLIDELKGLNLLLLARERSGGIEGIGVGDETQCQHVGQDKDQEEGEDAEIDIDCSGIRRALLGVW